MIECGQLNKTPTQLPNSARTLSILNFKRQQRVTAFSEFPLGIACIKIGSLRKISLFDTVLSSGAALSFGSLRLGAPRQSRRKSRLDGASFPCFTGSAAKANSHSIGTLHVPLDPHQPELDYPSPSPTLAAHSLAQASLTPVFERSQDSRRCQEGQSEEPRAQSKAKRCEFVIGEI